MTPRILALFVEGLDDERLVGRLTELGVFEGYDHVKVFPYASRSPEATRKIFQALRANVNADYLFFCDCDGAPCISKRKEKVLERYPFLDSARVIVVRRMIESWYVAGVCRATCRVLGIGYLQRTDMVGKTEFSDLIRPAFASRVDAVIVLASHFELVEAEKRNESFRWFIQRWCS
jgi:hypothetical protein